MTLYSYLDNYWILILYIIHVYYQSQSLLLNVEFTNVRLQLTFLIDKAKK